MRVFACSVSASSSSDAGYRALDIFVRSVLRQSEAGRVAEGLRHREVSVDYVVLGHVADVCEAGGDRLAAHGDAPARRPRDSGERLDQRAFSRTALADDRDELAGLDGERGLREYPLILGRHKNVLGIEPQRATIVTRHEAGAVEYEPEGADPDLSPSDDQCSLDELTVKPCAVSASRGPLARSRRPWRRPRRGSARRSGPRAPRRWSGRGRSSAAGRRSERSGCP